MDGTVASHPKVVSFRRSMEPGRGSMEPVSEQSPLLLPRTSMNETEHPLLRVISPIGSDDWDADADVETKSTWYLFLLTLGGLGLQIGWSVETSNGSVSAVRLF
jgi:solute carrier family 45, member 1/2/4